MNTLSHTLLLVLLVGLTTAGVVGIMGCDAVPGGCTSDADCSGSAAICDVSAAICVACEASSDCQDGAVCCQGDCRDGTVEELCGCDADSTGDGPTACNDQVCIVGDARASVATIGDGVCGCPCDPGIGGTVCTVDESAAGFSCGCDRTDPVGTCEAAAIDAAGIPHRPADTCAPDNSCVCFASTTVCEGSADCTGAGCVDLVNDATTCGVAGRICADDATGIAADARCLSGGCACNAAFTALICRRDTASHSSSGATRTAQPSASPSAPFLSFSTSASYLSHASLVVFSHMYLEKKTPPIAGRKPT
jgi:hypothetical protein